MPARAPRASAAPPAARSRLVVAMDHDAHRSVTSPTRGPAMTVPDTFPDSPTVRAVLVRSEWGHYRASLTLPGGRTQTITSDQLDGARAQVIDATRSYLAAEVRHPGRLHVEDPEGRWLLGVPHDGGDLVPLPDLPAAPPLTPRPPARPPVLPSRPAPPGRRGRELPAPRCAGRRRPPAAGSWPSPRSRSPSCSSPGSSTSRTPPAPRVAHQPPCGHATTSRPPPTSRPRPSRPPAASQPSRPCASRAPAPRPGVEASEAQAPSLLAAPPSVPAQARRSRPPRPCGRARADLQFHGLPRSRSSAPASSRRSTHSLPLSRRRWRPPSGSRRPTAPLDRTRNRTS